MNKAPVPGRGKTWEGERSGGSTEEQARAGADSELSRLDELKDEDPEKWAEAVGASILANIGAHSVEDEVVARGVEMILGSLNLRLREISDDPRLAVCFVKGSQGALERSLKFWKEEQFKRS